MENEEIEAVASILTEWNPLGGRAGEVTDLDNYRTEAIDIIFQLHMTPNAAVERIVMETLNDAFKLSLTPAECKSAAVKIVTALSSVPV